MTHVLESGHVFGLNNCGSWGVFWILGSKCLFLQAMVYLIGNDSCKDCLGPCKFHYSFCFFLLYDIKSEMLYLSFQVGFVTQIC